MSPLAVLLPLAITLVSEPAFSRYDLGFGTYAGLTGTIREIHHDADGNIVTVGHVTYEAAAASGIRRIGPVQEGRDNILVAKFAADGTLLWRTLIGGTGQDRGYGFDLDFSDHIYIGGRTSSTDFPVTAGAFDTVHNGGSASAESLHGPTDGFLLKLSADGSTLHYATFLGGSDQDGNRGGIAIDSDGNAYLCGSTSSSDYLDNPSSGRTANHLNSRPGGYSDGYVTKVSNDGRQVLFNRFIGSSVDWQGEELPVGCAVNGAGELVGIGQVWGNDAAVSADAYDADFNGGNSDLYLFKLSADGQDLNYATYFGGSGDEFAEHRLALASDDSLYVSGFTQSNDFPAINAAQPTPGGGSDDAFLARFSAAGQPLFSTYAGGSGSGWDETLFAAGLDRSGNAYVVGRTTSTDLSTSADAYQDLNAGGEEVVLRSYSPAGQLVFASYFGGSGDDYGRYGAVTPEGHLVFAAETSSTDLPTDNGAVTAANPAGDVYLARLVDANPLPLCGNAQVDSGEQCDDGNRIDSDGCSAACLNDCPAGEPMRLSHRTYVAGEDVQCWANRIEAADGVIVRSGAALRLDAPTVVLGPGFRALAGATLTAR